MQSLEDLFAPSNDLELHLVRKLAAAECHYFRTLILETALAENAAEADSKYSQLDAVTRLAFAERHLHRNERSLVLPRTAVVSASGNIEIHTQQVVESTSNSPEPASH